MTDVPEPTFEQRKSDAQNDAEELVLPAGWMYKQFKVGSFKLPWYASPPAQLFVVAVVCFMCPGMFNALNGMGGVCFLSILNLRLMCFRLASSMRLQTIWQTRLSTRHSRSSDSSPEPSRMSWACG
jgi:hypothetical protein